MMGQDVTVGLQGMLALAAIVRTAGRILIALLRVFDLMEFTSFGFLSILLIKTWNITGSLACKVFLH